MQKNQGNASYAFICYSRDDYDSVEPIVQALKRHNYNVWFDKDMIPDGETPVAEEIADRISNCAVFIAFHSATSVKSKWCMGEIQRAIRKEKAILQVSIHDVLPDLRIDPLLYISHENTETTLNWLEKAKPMSRCKRSDTEPKDSDNHDESDRNSMSVTASQKEIATAVWEVLGDYKKMMKGRHPESRDELTISGDQQTLYSSERGSIASDFLYRRNGFDFTYYGIAFRHKSLPFPSEYLTSWPEFANPQNTIKWESAPIMKPQQWVDSLKFWGVANLIAAVPLLVLFLCGVQAMRVPAIICIAMSFVLIGFGGYISRENIKYKCIFFLCVKQTQKKGDLCLQL